MAAVQPVHTAYYGFTGEINDASAAKIAANVNLAANNPQCNEIYLCMSTHGGFVHSGIYLHNHLRAIPKPITIHNTGSVHSIGLIVFLAGRTRYCSEGANFLTHATRASPSAGISEKTLKAVLAGLLADEVRTVAILIGRANIPKSVFTRRKAGDVLISSAQALQYGIVNEVREFTIPAGAQIVQI